MSVTKQMVLKSSNGWYIGTMLYDDLTGEYSPYSRDSMYLSSQEEAIMYLTMDNMSDYVSKTVNPTQLHYKVQS